MSPVSPLASLIAPIETYNPIPKIKGTNFNQYPITTIKNDKFHCKNKSNKVKKIIISTPYSLERPQSVSPLTISTVLGINFGSFFSTQVLGFYKINQVNQLLSTEPQINGVLKWGKRNYLNDGFLRGEKSWLFDFVAVVIVGEVEVVERVEGFENAHGDT